MAPAIRSAVYARVSTLDQEPENQLAELRRYVHARSWPAALEYVDHGVPGAKDRRPALDRLLRDARRGRIEVIVIWSLDRLGRSLRHLVMLLDEIHGLDISLVSLRDGLDLSTPAGRLQWMIIGAIGEFERARIAERVKAGLTQARRRGKRLGRPARRISEADLQRTADLSVREAAREIGVSSTVLYRARTSAGLS